MSCLATTLEKSFNDNSGVFLYKKNYGGVPETKNCVDFINGVESHLLVVLVQLDVLHSLVVDHPDDASVRL